MSGIAEGLTDGDWSGSAPTRDASRALKGCVQETDTGFAEATLQTSRDFWPRNIRNLGFMLLVHFRSFERGQIGLRAGARRRRS